MAFHISDETRRKTTKCPSNFSCLTDEKNPMCGPEKPMCPGQVFVEGSGLFVKAHSPDDCPYKMSFGFIHYICSCPVRHEIYRSYKK